MRRVITTLLFLTATGWCRAAEAPPVPRLEDMVSTFTLAAERTAFVEKHRRETLAGRLSKAPSEEWEGAFWAMLLMRERTPLTRQGCADFLAHFRELPLETQRAGLEAVYGLFPDEFGTAIEGLLPSIDHPKLFAMAANHLARQDRKRAPQLDSMMKKKFPGWEENPILFMLHHDLTTDAAAEVKGRPPLRDLLAWRTGGEWPVIYSLQRLDRRQPGLAVVRGKDGRFVRHADGTVFHISQLALSVSNLPGYITNGNTPEGVFSVIGAGVSENVFIGRTPYLLSVLPFEVPASEYLKTQTTGELAMEQYLGLLPPSWRVYTPMRQAWYAGRAGRCEIIVHGTTADTEYYRGETYYPYTPSLGCLTALELWNPKDGHALASNQVALLNAYLGAAGASAQGFLCVVDLDDRPAPVTIDEVLPDLFAAEALP